MKIQNIYHLLQAALLLLLAASCTQEEFPAAQDKARQLTISVTDGGYNTSAVDGKITRAVENGYTTEFTEGDACGLFMVRGLYWIKSANRSESKDGTNIDVAALIGPVRVHGTTGAHVPEPCAVVRVLRRRP